MNGELEKAYISILDGKNAGKQVECAFNPTEYRIEKRAGYTDHKTLSNVPISQFTYSEADRLSMKLFFDTTSDESDVREEYLNALDSLLEIDDTLNVPPRCRFIWGGGLDFTAVMLEAKKRFTLFLPDGTPVRAWVAVTFKEYQEPGQESTPGPTEPDKPGGTWTVTEGETLYDIADEAYGNPAKWRTIAKENNLRNPRSLEPGTTLTLPPE